ncbi:type IV pilus secretin PilQ [Thiothrix fructosivorans]|uniref:Type IV pilus secretin PilQ n=1 Tax=Thiothrix fructosivorans TaxID=111770 RepID=A0A8B0SM48_9GAMM|nr:type IV pilus secretin PilQ [Thiothrix fructosivorans]MBO0613442.1 type IV pilus secretin PilQ [Thiothrix fructosivorans]QTX11128.1 type IV pilus secretin PilQ [Thiothrix fructosivorans]
MKTIKQSVALALLMTCLPASNVALAADAQLQNISAQAAGNKTEVQLQFSAPVTLPKGFLMENPARLVFDFPATEVSANSRSKAVNLGNIQTIDAANNKGKARVVVHLSDLVDHSVEAHGNTVVMLFDNKGSKQAAAAPAAPEMHRSGKSAPDKFTPAAVPKPAATQAALPLPELPVPTELPPDYAWYAPPGGKPAALTPLPAPASAPVVMPATPPAPAAKPVVAAAPPVVVAPPVPKPVAANTSAQLQSVDFRRDADGSGRLIVRLPSADSVVTDDKSGNTVTLTVKNADVPANLQQRMDVMDFGTPVSDINVSQRDNSARIRIAAHEGFEHRTNRNGDEYTVYIDKLKATPEDKLQIGDKKKKNFTGEKLSLNFQDIEVRAVLQLLADFTDKNIVVSDTVAGNITVRLKDVPWDQALDIVLESKSLAMRENGNVIWVAPAAELAAKDEQEMTALKAKQELEPLVTEYIGINFAKAADIMALIEKSKSADEDKKSLLSPRGKVSVDERTNTLLVQDTATQVKSIRELIKVLDVPVEQVLIESRIVIASDSFGKELGARFGITPTWANQDSIGIGAGKLGSGTDKYWESATKAMADTTGTSTITIPGLSDRLSVNLPVTGAVGSYGFSILSKDFLVDLELSASQSENKSETISSPKVITSNQTKALIEQGVEVPYLQASSSGAANVAFKKAVLSMEVTPQITPDEHISMDLKVNQDTVGSIYSGVPSINTREIQTKVLVENGQTVVLGGVHEERNTSGTSKVPVLGDVPVLGRLFRTDNNSNTKNELLIFVTPKIVDSKS